MMKHAIFAIVLLLVAAGAHAALDPVKGTSWKYPMLHYIGDGNEYYVRHSSMCEGGGYVRVSWDAVRDYVDFHVVYNGLVRNPRNTNSWFQNGYCYEFNPSNDYNKWPDCIYNGRWRMILVHHVNKVPIKYYYDANDILLGSEYDYYGHEDLPSMPGVREVNGSGTIMLMTEHVQINQQGKVDQTFRFKYSSMRNYLGTTGIIDSKALTNLSDPTSLINLYTHQYDLKKPVPSYNWTQVLNEVQSGGGVTVLFSYQPFPEPVHMRGRDNLMLGPGATLSLTPGTNGRYDTPTCWARARGDADPFCGDVQVQNSFFYVCAP